MKLNSDKGFAQRTLVLVLWPIVFTIACIDSSTLDIYDFAILAVLTAMGSWGIATHNNLWRWLVACVMLATILIFVFSFGFALHAVVANKPASSNEFATGAAAFHNLLLPFRAYLILAGVSLFAMNLAPRRIRDETSRE